MMKISDFEKKIQKEIDSELEIVPNKNTPDASGVYHRGTYIGVTLPREYIMDTRMAFHADVYGVPFRGVKEAMTHIKAKLGTFTPDKRKKANEA